MYKGFFVIMLVVMGLLAGCATSVDRGHMLESTLIVYEKTIRWGNFEAAHGFRKPGTDVNPQASADGRDIRIGGYDVVNQSMSEDGMRLTQWVEISYFHSDSARVIKVVDKQAWEYDRDAGRWYLTTSLPEFK